jgi:hypothetical protein
MAFLGIMMKSIPVSVDSEFSKIFKGFKAKTFKDIAQKSGATLKGSDKIILDKFEKLVFAFVEAYRKTGSGQVGGGGNSPNQMVRYNPREARINILRHIRANPGLYIAAATVAYNGLLVYIGYNQINIILNEPLAFRSNNSQNQPMGSALVVHDEGGNQVAVIDLTELELPPVTLYDVFFNTREAMRDIATDITLQLEQAKQNAIATAKNEITTQFNERRQNYIDKLITDMGLNRKQSSAFRRLAAARNLVNGEQFGRAGEDAVRDFRRFGEDMERNLERLVQNVVRDVGRSIEDQSVIMIRTVQDAAGMAGEGTFYFFTIASSYLVYRCFRGRCSRRRNRRNGIQNRGGPQFDVLNNNAQYNNNALNNNNASNNNNAPSRSDVPRGGKRTKRHRRKKSKKSHKKRHRKNKKSHKKRRRRRKKTRKSRR